jgi:hypothetical protein
MKLPASYIALILALVPSISAAYDEVYMTCLVNAQRAQAGLSPLGIDSHLTNSAQGHSNWQASAQTMSHTGAGGSSPGDRIEAAGFNWQYMGENVAYGYDTEDSVMQKWMDSAGHRENILSANFNMMGSAVAYTGSTPYWTQDFGNDGSGARNVPDCNGGGSNTQTTQPATTPAKTTPATPAKTTTPAPPSAPLTPERLGLVPIQPATDGTPSNGPTGPVVIVVGPTTTTPSLPVTIPANSSPVSPQDLQAASVPPAPASAPAPAPAAAPITIKVTAASVDLPRSSPFSPHTIPTGPGS